MLHDTFHVNLKFFFPSARILDCIALRIPRRFRVNITRARWNPVWCDFTASLSQLQRQPSRWRERGRERERKRDTTDNVFPADAAVKSLEIQVYSSRRESSFPRGHITSTRTGTGAHYKYTRGSSRAAASTGRELSRTGIVSHGANLNEIRSAEEAVSRFRTIRSGGEKWNRARPLGPAPSIGSM